MSYQALEKIYYRLAQLEHASGILSWDQAVMMPPKANEHRGRAMAELQVMATELLQGEQLPDLFAAAQSNQAELSDWQQANLREMHESWQRSRAIPKELVEAEAMAGNECEHAWRTLRAENNWQDFAPKLQTVFDLARQKAQCLQDALGPVKGYANSYDALLDIYDPGSTTKQVDAVFAELKQELPALVQQIMAEQAKQPKILAQQSPVSTAKQQQLSEAIMAKLGFDFDSGRLDTALHPFSGGTVGDNRITTRYDENSVFESIMATVHETGHASYEAGLPAEWAYQPVGGNLGMSVHESQSLFYELQIGRSRPFVEAIAPLLNHHFGSDPAFAADNLYREYTQVKPGLIRVNADEVTYPLHVILRYELERDIILGAADVKDIPERWDTAMEQYLGLDTRGNFKDGPMQDIHWPAGAIGYFPSYTLGAMTAAQWHHGLLQAVPNAPELVATLQLQPIFDWLSENIWQHGRFYSFDALLNRATGESLNSKYFLNHLRERYL